MRYEIRVEVKGIPTDPPTEPNEQHCSGFGTIPIPYGEDLQGHIEMASRGAGVQAYYQILRVIKNK